MSIVLLTSIIFTTMVYSAFSTKLQIDGDLIVRSDNDIRVTNISIKETTNGAYETYNNKYTKDITSMFVTLPSNSSITYEVEITNKSDNNYTLSLLNELSRLNNNLLYTIDTEQYDIYDSNSIRKVTIIISNNTNDEISDSLVLEYKFSVAYSMFIDGKSFNAKIKNLAGNGNATYKTEDSYIKNIVRSSLLNSDLTENNIISTSDSTVPIYAWYDEGTIYYYTKYDKPLMNYDGSYMYSYLSVIESVDLSTIDTSSTTNMEGMFSYCKATSLDVSSFNTSEVKSMLGMFESSYATTITGLTNFNTSEVSDIRAMFRRSYVKELDLTSFDTSRITSMMEMFHDSKAITIDISSFDTSKVTHMGWMFQNSQVVTIYASEKFVTSDVVISERMFYNAINLIGGNGTVFDSSHINKEYARVDTDETPGYFTLKEN